MKPTFTTTLRPTTRRFTTTTGLGTVMPSGPGKRTAPSPPRLQRRGCRTPRRPPPRPFLQDTPCPRRSRTQRMSQSIWKLCNSQSPSFWSQQQLRRHISTAITCITVIQISIIQNVTLCNTWDSNLPC